MCILLYDNVLSYLNCSQCQITNLKSSCCILAVVRLYCLNVYVHVYVYIRHWFTKMHLMNSFLQYNLTIFCLNSQ